jgi:hypothetical protein
MLNSLFVEESDGETDLVGMVNEHFLMLPRRGGSSKKREANVDHDQEVSHADLYKDYFDLINPLFKEMAFCRGYRISRELFLVILYGVREYDDYF